jgi:hypothetical protein
LVWAFHGPLAEGTADHFARHLREFMEREALEGEVGSEARGPASRVVWLEVTAEVADRVEPALKPQRVLVRRA